VDQYAWLAVVTLLALIEYTVIGMLVGRARGRYGVAAPATTGHEVFERWFRVQANTVEQLVVFVPALWLFGVFVHEGAAALLGLVFVLGRALYARGYVQAPDRRGPGFALTVLPNAIMLIGGIAGALAAAF
jgi:uncharacterized membrane protein YecN with MAPEG domain